ncbi:uncharacterized protein [Miscanthus floridulus]|uniref:uncharacterized protein isoform X1 n=1 Tax=Miscanthus floridulus TaxID=154761 RepID=UPI00345AF3A6
MMPSLSPRATTTSTRAVEPTAHSASPEPRLSYSPAATATPSRASDDSCVVNDVDAFARTIAAIRSRPPAAAAAGSGTSLASVLSHYAARWLPDAASSPSGRFLLPPESPTAAWLRKRLLLESLVAALPPDDGDGDGGKSDGITCDFLLRLLRAGSTVGADAALLGDLEARVARRLDQASLGAVMIPAFGGLARGALAPCAPYASPPTLLDVPLVLRLVRGFLREGAKAGGGGAAAARVARLVDAYLAEAALEAGLRPSEFEELARAVPAHARAADDGLYRAVDTYLKMVTTPTHTHPNENTRTPTRDQGGAAVAVPADRRAQAVGGGGRARRAERPPAGALRGPGALPVVGARRQAHRRPPPPRRVERRGRRLLPRPATDHQEPRHRRFPRPPLLQRCRRRGRQRAVPVQARGRRRGAAPRAAAPPRGRCAPPGAVPRAAGAGGPAGLGGRPAAAGAVQVGRRVPVRRRRPGRRRDVEGGRLRQRRGQDAAQRGEAGAGHADRVKVAQVSLLKPSQHRRRTHLFLSK